MLKDFNSFSSSCRSRKELRQCLSYALSLNPMRIWSRRAQVPYPVQWWERRFLMFLRAHHAGDTPGFMGMWTKSELEWRWHNNSIWFEARTKFLSFLAKSQNSLLLYWFFMGTAGYSTLNVPFMQNWRKVHSVVSCSIIAANYAHDNFRRTCLYPWRRNSIYHIVQN